jgi:hypothetical protein
MHKKKGRDVGEARRAAQGIPPRDRYCGYVETGSGDQHCKVP